MPPILARQFHLFRRNGLRTRRIQFPARPLDPFPHRLLNQTGLPRKRPDRQPPSSTPFATRSLNSGAASGFGILKIDSRQFRHIFHLLLEDEISRKAYGR